MDIETTNPYRKRKIKSDSQTDDYLRSLNKDFEIDKDTKEFSKKFLHEYQKLKNENIEFWKNQYFHKLPPPWDEICINKYISYLEKHSK
ncbi:hypothetical protein Gotur_013086, partial [Gossypium turneri]